MAHKIAKTLLIGLGGTGISALNYAKQRYFDTYANDKEIIEGVENFSIPMVEYLAIDTSITDLDRSLLQPLEYFYASVSDPVSVIKQTPFVHKWMIKKNTDNPEAISDGAHQIRQYGRLAFMYNYGALKNKIQSKINKLNSYVTTTFPRYEFLGGPSSKVNVVFCFSVAGGTGSGTFLDIAYLTKSLGANITSQAYLVLPDIFDRAITQAIAKTNIFSNGYAALRELDYLMNGKFKKDIKLADNISIPYDGRPFKLVHLISAQNMEGICYDEKNHILELIGNNIVLKSGELNIDGINSWDNISTALTNYKYLDKQETQIPRYLGLGYAELKYDTGIYVDFLKTTYSKFLMDQIQDSNNRVSEQELDSLVISWGIKEHETDLLIDSILPSNTGSSFVVEGNGYFGSETLNRLKQEGDNWLSSQKTRLKQKADEKLDDLFQNKIPLIVDLIKHDILNRGGINTAQNMISLLSGDKFIRLYESEMNDEISENYNNTNRGLKELIVEHNTQLTNKYNELSEALNGSFFGKTSRCLPIIDDIINFYNSLAKLNSEFIRRENAKMFYSRLHSGLSSLSDELKTFENKIRANHNSFSNKIQDIIKSNKSSHAKPFVINLHEDDINNNSQVTNTITLDLFIEGKYLYNILHQNNDNILESVNEHISSLSSIEDAEKNKNITNYLANKSEDDRQSLFTRIELMSSPLFKVNMGTFKMDIQLVDGTDGWMQGELWAVNNKEHQMFKNIKADPFKETQTTFNNNVLSVSQINYPAPMFALANMSKYKNDYESNLRSQMSCDLDKRLTENINKDKFEIVQKSEVEKGHMFAWVFGCVLHTLTDGEKGIKRSGNGKYEIINEEHGSELNDYCVSLEHSRRDEAFQFFSENDYSDAMRNDFFKVFNSFSLEDQKELVTNLNDKDCYFEKYAGIGRNITDIMRGALNNPNDKKLEWQLRGELDLLSPSAMNIDSIREY
jgi:hypothetical protein